MVMDFVALKKQLKAFVDEFDHKTILPGNSPDVKLTISDDSVEAISCGKRYVFPLMDVVIIDVSNTTAEEMTKLMVNRMVSEVEFPSNVRSVAVGLDEERGQTAWYEVKI